MVGAAYAELAIPQGGSGEYYGGMLCILPSGCVVCSEVASSKCEFIIMKPIARFAVVIGVLGTVATMAAADDNAAARRAVLLRSYGTYAGDMRKPDGRLDCERLIAELGEMHATTYNFLIARGKEDWEDLHTFLPLAKARGLRVWVTVLPPSESPPRTKNFSEPFRLDYEKWAGELAALSTREPALVAWSIDDFAYNSSTFTPEAMQKIIAAQRAKNPQFAFVPCIYFKQATPAFAAKYREFFDGILFPYRSESTKAGFEDAKSVVAEVQALKERFGGDLPIIVDIYATRHSRLGPSTPAYVEQVMNCAYPVADGVHIYRHQNKLDANEREKYDIVERVMGSWAAK